MIDKKLLEVLSTTPDAALAIVTRGPEGPHMVNSWNSYVQINGEGELLIPAGRMHETEKNIRRDPRVQLTICNREVEGLRYRGTGFLLTGEARFTDRGSDFETVKARYPWARAVLAVKILTAEQTL